MHHIRRYLVNKLLYCYVHTVYLIRLFEMDSRKNSGNTLPPKSVVGQLLDCQDARLPSIFPIASENEDTKKISSPTNVRHAVDPVLRDYAHASPIKMPSLQQAPKKRTEIRKIRSRSLPSPNCPKWKNESLKNSTISKKQPTISVASHIVPPRLKPKCRWEGFKNRSKPRSHVLPLQNIAAKDVQKPPRQIGVSTPTALNMAPGPLHESLNTETGKAKDMGISDKNTEVPVDQTCPAKKCTECNHKDATGRMPSFFGAQPQICEEHNSQDLIEIVSAKQNEEKAETAGSTRSAELMKKYKDLKKALAFYQSLKLSPAIARKSKSVLNVSKLVPKSRSVDRCPDEADSIATSDFRMTRNVTWLKEQQEFIPTSLSEIPERKDYGDNLSKRRNPQHWKSLLNQDLKSKDMDGQPQRSRSCLRGILKPAMKSRSRSVPSPVFRFQFKGEPSSTDISKFDSEREIKYLRIALAARQGFLKELRHRVHKAHTIFKRHHVGAVSLFNGTEAQELLSSHQCFVKWLDNFVQKGAHDINKFDELNIFVNEEKDFNYYFETQFVHKGNAYGGIFIPVPFNEQLITEVRSEKSQKLPDNLKSTRSAACQHEERREIGMSRQWVYNREPTTIVTMDDATQTRSEIKLLPPETLEKEIQTNQPSTAEQQNQTSRTSLFREPSQIPKSKSIFQLKSLESCRSIPSTAESGIKSHHSPARSSRSQLPPVDYDPGFTSTPKLCDELSICESETDKPINPYLRSTFSSSTLDKSSMMLEDEVEAIFSSERNSVSLGSSSSKKSLEENTYKSSENLLDQIHEAAKIRTPCVYPSFSASSIKSVTPATSAISEESISKSDQTLPKNASPFPVRASATEENIRRKIESITDMIRQFRSESFETTWNVVRSKEVQAEKPASKASLKCKSIKSNINMAESTHDSSKALTTTIDSIRPQESSTEFYSFTNIPPVVPTQAVNPLNESTVCDKSESKKSSGTISSQNTVKSKIQTPKDRSSSHTVYYDFLHDGPPPVNILFGKSFKKLNDSNVRSDKSENSIADGALESLTKARSSCSSIRSNQPRPRLTGESENFLQTHLQKLKSELLTSSEVQDTPPNRSPQEAPTLLATDHPNFEEMNEPSKCKISITKMSGPVSTPEVVEVAKSQSSKLSKTGTTRNLPVASRLFGLELEPSTPFLKPANNRSLVSAEPCIQPDLESLIEVSNETALQNVAINAEETLVKSKIEAADTDTSDLEDSIALPIAPKIPPRSRIPIPKLPKLALPTVVTIDKTDQNERVNSKKKSQSNSYPGSPCKIVRPAFFTPRESFKAPAIKKAVVAAPSIRSRPASAMITSAGKTAGPSCASNRFGFSQASTTSNEPANKLSTFGTTGRNMGISRVPKPFTPRNRNLEESCSPSITSPGLFLTNPKMSCNYTTEYGAAFNRFSRGNSDNRTGISNNTGPQACQHVISKTLAANFNSK